MRKLSVLLVCEEVFVEQEGEEVPARPAQEEHREESTRRPEGLQDGSEQSVGGTYPATGGPGPAEGRERSPLQDSFDGRRNHSGRHREEGQRSCFSKSKRRERAGVSEGSLVLAPSCS